MVRGSGSRLTAGLLLSREHAVLSMASNEIGVVTVSVAKSSHGCVARSQALPTWSTRWESSGLTVCSWTCSLYSIGPLFRRPSNSWDRYCSGRVSSGRRSTSLRMGKFDLSLFPASLNEFCQVHQILYARWQRHWSHFRWYYQLQHCRKRMRF